MSGEIESIYIAINKRERVIQVDSAVLEAGTGIIGDRYHARSEQLISEGNPTKNNHLTLIEKEKLDEFLQANSATQDYGDFRRNIVTSGIDLNALVGKKFRVGETVCEGFELCEPCAFLAESVHRAVLPDLVHKAGLRAKIIEGGNISTGDEIAIYE